MRREGRQHGTVRAHPIFSIAAARRSSRSDPRPVPRFNRVEPSAAAGGGFARAPSKPTNHSKFTGKCRLPQCSGCHHLPAGKAQSKAKCARKARSNDVVLNSRFAAWRVSGGAGGSRNGSDLAGVSATAALDSLRGGCGDDEEEEKYCDMFVDVSDIQIYDSEEGDEDWCLI